MTDSERLVNLPLYHNERLAYRLALQTAAQACQIARTLIQDMEDYADSQKRIEEVEAELSDMSTLYPARP